MQELPIRRLLYKGFIFLTLVMITCINLHFFLPIDQNNSYLAAIIDKNLILESVSDSRLIIVGGSNVALGLDSEKLELLTNKRVINDGLYGYLGMRYILNNLINFIRFGDIVIIMPELLNFYDKYIDGYHDAIPQMLDVYPQAVYSLEYFQLIKSLGAYFPLLRSKIIRSFNSPTDDSPVYFRGGFNSHGDLISQLGMPEKQKITSQAYIKNNYFFNQDSIVVFNRFAEQAYLKGAQVFLIFPALRNTNCKATGDYLEILNLKLRSELIFPILNNPADSCMADNYFFDTYYHLSAEGRKIRTQEIYRLLITKKILSQW